MSGSLQIEEVHNVSFVDGVMITGLVEGLVTEGDHAELSRADGSVVVGTVGAFHIHTKPGDDTAAVRVALEGDLAEAVGPGDVVSTRPSTG